MKLLAIIGPTATGKSELAVLAAQRLNGEIISCDSMQIYRGLDIGTGKLPRESRRHIPHHMLDIIEVGDEYSVAQYASDTKAIITAMNKQKRLPVLAGGSGLFYQAVVDDYFFFPMEKKARLRLKWSYIIKEKGLDHAYKKLVEIDPLYASIISHTDQKRIIRALEVFELTGEAFSKQQNKKDNVYDLVAVGLEMERSQLYEKIDRRIDQMFSSGLLEEATSFLKAGFDLGNNAMQALGYKQIWHYWKGLTTYDGMVKAIKKETRNYAKRQMTWFKKDRRIRWLKVLDSDNVEDVYEKFYYIWKDKNK